MKAIRENTKTYIQIFDVEREIGYETNVEFTIPFKNLECFGQLNKDNVLYLCGTDKLTDDLNIGSFFCKYEVNEPKIGFLISSNFNHYGPSMISFQDEILVIGGKGSIKCERISMVDPKWISLPDLPERYC